MYITRDNLRRTHGRGFRYSAIAVKLFHVRIRYFKQSSCCCYRRGRRRKRNRGPRSYTLDAIFRRKTPKSLPISSFLPPSSVITVIHRLGAAAAVNGTSSRDFLRRRLLQSSETYLKRRPTSSYVFSPSRKIVRSRCSRVQAGGRYIIRNDSGDTN